MPRKKRNASVDGKVEAVVYPGKIDIGLDDFRVRHHGHEWHDGGDTHSLEERHKDHHCEHRQRQATFTAIQDIVELSVDL
jgi:hypothetical protein